MPAPFNCLVRAAVLLALLFGSRLPAAAFDYTGGRILIGKSVSAYRDEAGTLTAADVLAKGVFVPATSGTLNLDLSKAASWIRFSVINRTDEQKLFLELDNPLLDHLEIYQVQAGSAPRLLLRSGIDLPFASRGNGFTNFVCALPAPKDREVSFLIRTQSNEQLVLPIVLGTEEAINSENATRNLVVGLFAGVLLVMILYNLFIYFSTKERSYLAYVLFILSVGLAQLTLLGYTYKFLYPNSPRFFNQSVILFSAAAGIIGAAFVRSFLSTKKNAPRADAVLKAIILLYTVPAALRLAGFDILSSRMTDVSGLVAALAVFFISLMLAIRGQRTARFFVIAWTIFLAGLVLFVLRNLSIVGYSSFSNYTLEAGTAIEVTLLSIALADRINILKRETEVSQRAALAAARENERLVTERAVFLEQKVKERTEELEVANTDLSSALTDLKSTQSQLVQQEKMASLGQLTAGIAHEINNPINFVTSNVRPLRRDIDLLLKAYNEVEQLALEEAPVAKKQERINALKEEIEYDYLVTEIDFLLTGISDGAGRTAEIVKGLRIFSRVDEDDLKRADINEGLDSTAIIVNTLLNNLIVIKKDYGDLPMIECYPGKLNQVFLNIISNAIYAVRTKFGAHHGGEIDIQTLAKDGNVIIRISDNGPGIPEDIRGRLFEPFFTTKDVGEGTGLGLSIAYNIIEKHNGTIEALQDADGGGLFVITLPIMQVTPLPVNVNPIALS